MNAGRSCTGDLLIVDVEDLKTMPPSETHKSKERDILKKTLNLYSIHDGLNLSRRTAVMFRFVQCGVRLHAGSKILQKEKKKPEIQIQMPQLDKISGASWEMTCLGTKML